MFLLDTCVISELIKKDPSKELIEWIRSHPEHHFFLSVITIAEIGKGISRLDDGNRKTELLNWLHHDVTHRFKGRILSIDESVALAFGKLLGEFEKKGRKVPVMDGFIASSCIVHGCTLVTRNIKDFDGLPLNLLNPWEAK